MTLLARDVSLGFGARPVLEQVSLELAPGQLLGLVGPNGAGKSTLLKCLSGMLSPQRGRIELNGIELARRSRRAIARLIAVVPQACTPAFPVSVAYFVGMGRYARESRLLGPSPADARIVRRCLDELELAALAERPIDALSGGEFRRVLIAQALAQEPAILLFDEPVQQLDLRHQLEVMEFARAFARRAGKSGLIVLHDLTLAARFCDAVLLLSEGRIVAQGSPEQVLTEANVRRAYRVQAAVQRCPATHTLQVVALAVARSAQATEDRS
ncbi:MAG: ABC transporter ATP-binding protein [Planctomycetota bacterium]